MAHRFRPLPRFAPLALAVVGGLTVAAGCSSSSLEPGSAGPTKASQAPTGQTMESPRPAPLRVLVSNDDGYAAPGIDGIVEALRSEPNVEVTVVAPLKNQSGTGGQTTSGPLTVTDVTTKSGRPAKAVEGFPADSVNWALDGGINFKPDLVVAGNNAGQNVGVTVELSGTVGAARAGAKHGIPAVAVSQGLGNPIDYASGTKVFLDWFRANRASLPPPTAIVSFNIPSCASGAVRGVVVVPTASAQTGSELAAQDCTSTATNPPNDVTALTTGFATQSTVGLGAP